MVGINGLPRLDLASLTTNDPKTFGSRKALEAARCGVSIVVNSGSLFTRTFRSKVLLFLVDLPFRLYALVETPWFLSSLDFVLLQ